MTVVTRPLTPARWDDLERLFGPNGAYGGCWCMWWRVTGREFEAGGDANRARLRAVVESSPRPTGLLAFDGDEPVGWVAIAPRDDYGRVNRSRDLAPVDDRAAWSITCFYVARRHRGRGVARALLDAAVAFAAEHGAEVVEGYAVDTAARPRSSADAYTGTVGMFEQAGFVRVAQRRPNARVVMRRDLSTG